MKDIFIVIIGSVITAFGAGFFNPYSTFLFSMHSNRLEKNIALRESLLESERNRELDYVISQQVKKHSFRSLRREIQPARIFKIVYFGSNFLWMFIILTVILNYIENHYSLTFSASFLIALSLVFLVSIIVRFIVGKKAKEVDLNYGYYGAYLRSDNRRDHVADTPINVILRIPKFSISEKGSHKEIITHSKIYSYDKESGLAHVYALDTGGAIYAANAKITIANFLVAKNEILIFSYTFQETILADNAFKENKRVTVVPHKKDFCVNTLSSQSQIGRLTTRIKQKLEVKETLYFRNIFQRDLRGIQKRDGEFSWWEQIQDEEPDHRRKLMYTNGYPNFR